MMKKAICILLAVIMCAAVAGCGNSQYSRSANGSQGKSVKDILSEKMNESERTAEDLPGQSKKEPLADTQPIDETPVDIDLTTLSSTMVYSEVYNMMSSPEDYLGKRVRMKGSFAYSQGDGRYYFACIIADATACCSQGIEFVLKDERKFPDEYPKEGEEITVAGIFDTYTEGTYKYCQLLNAVME